MTNTTENQTAKTKQVPDFYIFENGPAGEKGGKHAGAAFRHKKGPGFTLLIGGKRYAACQTACNRDPGSASKRDPSVGGFWGLSR